MRAHCSKYPHFPASPQLSNHHGGCRFCRKLSPLLLDLNRSLANKPLGEIELKDYHIARVDQNMSVIVIIIVKHFAERERERDRWSRKVVLLANIHAVRFRPGNDFDNDDDQFRGNSPLSNRRHQ